LEFVHNKKRMQPRKCALALAAAAMTVCADAQVKRLAPAQSLSVSAKEIGSSGAIEYRWATDYGSYDRDFFTRQDVGIEAHNLSRLPAKIVIDFFFVGQPEHQDEPRKLFSKRTFTIDVSPGYQKRVSLRSDVLKSNEQKYVLLGEQYNSGYHLAGWFLRARAFDDVKPFSYASSNPAWIERLGWFDAALVELYREAPEANNERQSSPPSPPTTVAARQAIVASEPLHPKKDVAREAPSYVLTNVDVPLRLEYGAIVIRRGTRLRVVKRDESTVYVEFGSTLVPLSITVVQ
jgi:hypothetical protein